MINNDTLKAKLGCYNINHKIKSKQLELLFDCSGRVIRDGVRALRNDLVPIGSIDAEGDDGYFTARNYTEYEPTINNLLSRAYSLIATAKNAAKAFDVILQEELPFT